jgi:hypothetical protein
MTSDRDTTRILRAWLEDGVSELPDRVLDAVLDQVPTVRQRRPPHTWLLGSGLPSPLAIGVVALVIAVALGIGLVGRHLGERTQSTPTPSPTPAFSPTPLGALQGQPELSEGRYLVTGMHPLTVSLVVPDGWSAHVNWAVLGPDGAEAPGGMSLGFWRVANLYADPLQASAGLLDPPVGPSVDDLVAALEGHAGWTTEGTVDVAVDGFTGKRVALTVPHVEFDDCGIRPFLIWRDPSGGERCAQGPGQILHIYIIDVDGDRTVFDAAYFPATSAEDLAALQRVVDSIEISLPPDQD